MKNNGLFFTLAFAGAAVFFSCSPQQMTPEQTDDENTGASEITVSLATGDSGTIDSKTIIDYDENAGVYHPSWSAGDRMGLYVDAPANASGAVLTNAAAGEKAVFTGKIASLATGTHTIYGYYPQDAFVSYDETSGTSFRIPAVQYPTATSFDPAADLLIAKSQTVDYAGGNLSIDNVRFARPMAVVKVVLRDKTINQDFARDDFDLRVKSMSLWPSDPVNQPLAGTAVIDLKGEPEIKSFVGNGGCVTADFTAAPYRIDNETNAAYFVVNPVDYTDGGSIILNVDAGRCGIVKELKMSEKGVALKAGQVTVINVDVTSSDSDNVCYWDNWSPQNPNEHYGFKWNNDWTIWNWMYNFNDSEGGFNLATYKYSARAWAELGKEEDLQNNTVQNWYYWTSNNVVVGLKLSQELLDAVGGKDLGIIETPVNANATKSVKLSLVTVKPDFNGWTISWAQGYRIDKVLWESTVAPNEYWWAQALPEKGVEIPKTGDVMILAEFSGEENEQNGLQMSVYTQPVNKFAPMYFDTNTTDGIYLTPFSLGTVDMNFRVYRDWKFQERETL